MTHVDISSTGRLNAGSRVLLAGRPDWSTDRDRPRFFRRHALRIERGGSAGLVHGVERFRRSLDSRQPNNRLPPSAAD